MDFAETWRSVGSGVSNIFRTGEKQPRRETQHILPESVRYSLQYGKGRLGIPEITSLAYDSYFKTGAVYLALKWLDGDAAQFNLFSDIVHHLDGKPGKPLPEILLPYLKEATNKEGVDGKKLAQYSRQTPEIFDNGFTTLAENAYSQKSLPILITNAGFLGLPALIETARARHDKFGILHTSTFTNESKMSGYTVSFEDNEVNINNSLDPLLSGAKHVTLIDDALHTQNTKTKVLSEWNRQNSTIPVDFQAAVAAPSEAIV